MSILLLLHGVDIYIITTEGCRSLYFLLQRQVRRERTFFSSIFSLGYHYHLNLLGLCLSIKRG